MGEKQIHENKNIKLDHWETKWKNESIRVFQLADKDHNGFIDLEELANVRNSHQFAETMMGVRDTNKDGKLSLGEWNDYVKSLFDQKEATCQSVLKLYEKQIHENRELKASHEVAQPVVSSADAASQKIAEDDIIIEGEPKTTICC